MTDLAGLGSAGVPESSGLRVRARAAPPSRRAAPAPAASWPPDPLLPPSPGFADGVLAVLDLDRLGTIGADEVEAPAAAPCRVSRTYLVPSRTAHATLYALRHTHQVLTVDGGRAATYASQYFDTPTWDSWRTHADGNGTRWAVRTRLCLEEQVCRVEYATEVGVDGTAAQTVEHGLPVPVSQFWWLASDTRLFLHNRCGTDGLDVDVAQLRPVVRIDFVRASLWNTSEGTHLTVDGGLVGSHDGRIVRLQADHVLVRTSGGARPGLADRLLRQHGARESAVSPYGDILARLEPSLPGHRWSSVAGKHFLPADD